MQYDDYEFKHNIIQVKEDQLLLDFLEIDDVVDVLSHFRKTYFGNHNLNEKEFKIHQLTDIFTSSSQTYWSNINSNNEKCRLLRIQIKEVVTKNMDESSTNIKIIIEKEFKDDNINYRNNYFPIKFFDSNIVSHGQFGIVRLFIHDRRSIIGKEVDIHDELDGVKMSMMTRCPFLRPIGYKDKMFYYWCGSKKKVPRIIFKRNLLSDIYQLKSCGLQHCDIHSGNITTEGFLIDAGLICQIGKKPARINRNMAEVLNGLIDDDYDFRSIIKQGGIDKLFEDVNSHWEDSDLSFILKNMDSGYKKEYDPKEIDQMLDDIRIRL